MSFLKKLKHTAIKSRIEDESLYERVLQELEFGIRRDGLWAQAVEKSQGDNNKITSIYIRLRVQSLRDELELRAADTRLSESPRRSLPESRTRLAHDLGDDGLTPLMRAVQAKNVESIRSLIAAGADRSAVDGNFGTSRAIDMARLGLARSATPEEKDQWERIINELSG
jgi:ankyrin repeat protein